MKTVMIKHLTPWATKLVEGISRILKNCYAKAIKLNLTDAILHLNLKEIVLLIP